MDYRKLDGAGRDHSEAVLEEATFKGGIPVHTDGKVVVIKKYDCTAVRTAGASSISGKNSGVIRQAGDDGLHFGN
jgi:hypothetical protein